MFRRWRQHKHSQTIAGLTFGPAALYACDLIWPDGGNWFDIFSIPSGVVFGIGLQGLIRMCFCEATKEEDPPLV